MEKYIKGLLTPEKSRQYREHIQDCENCAKSYRKIKTALRNREAQQRNSLVGAKFKVLSNEEFVPPLINSTIFDVARIERSIQSTKSPAKKVELMKEAIEEVEESDIDPLSKSSLIKYFAVRLDELVRDLPTVEEFSEKMDRARRMTRPN